MAVLLLRGGGDRAGTAGVGQGSWRKITLSGMGLREQCVCLAIGDELGLAPTAVDHNPTACRPSRLAFISCVLDETERHSVKIYLTAGDRERVAASDRRQLHL